MNFIIKKGNTDVFYEPIKLLNNFVIQEWIEEENKIEKFKVDSAKIVIILDLEIFDRSSTKNLPSFIPRNTPKVSRG